MKSSTTRLLPLLLLLGSAAAVTPLDLWARQQTTCPQLHVLGARETTSPQGFGTSQAVVDLVIKAFPGTTSEAIVYPAAGGPAYASSVTDGIAAVINQTQTFARQCPGSRMVLVGYSQGGQIMDDAFCGGPDGQSLVMGSIPMPSDVGAMVAAMIWMGNPRFAPGLAYNAGTAKLGGVSGFAQPLVALY